MLTALALEELWVFDSVQSRMVFRKVAYVPALYKIFDEILVNAADNLQRDPEGMDAVKVDIDQESGVLLVWNNGRGLPVVMHKEQKAGASRGFNHICELFIKLGLCAGVGLRPFAHQRQLR